MKKIFRILLIIIALIIFLVLGGYLAVRFMPEKSMKRTTADLSISAEELSNNYSNNPENSDKLYIGKIIQVSGIVNEITSDQNESVVVILEGEQGMNILCTFQDAPKDIEIGKQVTIKGTCNGALFEVVMNKCVLIK